MGGSRSTNSGTRLAEFGDGPGGIFFGPESEIRMPKSGTRILKLVFGAYVFTAYRSLVSLVAKTFVAVGGNDDGKSVYDGYNLRTNSFLQHFDKVNSDGLPSSQ